MDEGEQRETERIWAQIAPHCHHAAQKVLGETDDMG